MAEINHIDGTERDGKGKGGCFSSMFPLLSKELWLLWGTGFSGQGVEGREYLISPILNPFLKIS